MPYKRIHIWEFPPNRTYIFLKDDFRIKLLSDAIGKIGLEKLAETLNEKSDLYGQKTHFHHGHICVWRKGGKKRGNNLRPVNIPIWVLIEISKIISPNNYLNILSKIEKNIVLYRGLGKAKSVYNVKLPILLTPETISIIFHLSGDGHVGTGEDISHYRQVNKEGLECFIQKLRNIFGDFDLTIREGSKVTIPRIITDFYLHYFKLNTLGWDIARIPDKIKNMNKEFLLAGLTSFIIDEGHISSDVIEIYYKNKNLIGDIKEISEKIGYSTRGPGEKYRYGKLDSYRIYISTKDARKFYSDILVISKKFPTCKLAHKMKLL